MTDLPPNRRDVNTVFQSYALFDHLSIWDNVAFGLRRRGWRRAEIKQRVGEMLELVQLTGRDKDRPRRCRAGSGSGWRWPAPWSTGPRCCCSTSRSPRSTSSCAGPMQVELKRIQREVGITFVFVTHDQDEALTMSDSIAVMSDGAVHQVGTPEDIYERPDDARSWPASSAPPT